MQDQVATLFDNAAFHLAQSGGGPAAPPAEPLLTFSQPAQSPGDPFDLLGLNDFPVAAPATPSTPGKRPQTGDLERLKDEVVDAVRAVVGQLLSIISNKIASFAHVPSFLFSF